MACPGCRSQSCPWGSRCLEQQGQFSTQSCKGRPHRESWEVILGGEFREIGVLSGVGVVLRSVKGLWVCETKVCLRKAKRKWDVEREQGDVGSW